MNKINLIEEIGKVVMNRCEWVLGANKTCICINLKTTKRIIIIYEFDNYPYVVLDETEEPVKIYSKEFEVISDVFKFVDEHCSELDELYESFACPDEED